MQIENRATTNDFSVDRIAVTGGWIYVTRAWDQRSNTFSIAQAFVADATSPGDIIAPTNVDVPMASQSGSTLSCTMGSWTGEPTSYSYQWQIDGVSIGIAAAEAAHAVVPEEVGKTATCVVTATNVAGSTIAPPSNSVVVT